MAIAYLVPIDLNNNQLLDFKVYNRTSDETGLSGEGQLIYRTDINVLKYHTGGNTWVTVGTADDSWILNGDSGASQTINNNNTVLITGGTYITTAVSATDTLTINHDLTTRVDATSTATPSVGGTFTAVDSVTTNTTGHITALNLKTVTLPVSASVTSLPVKNSGGDTQFTSSDTTGIRFAGTGGASVTFNSATQLVTYNSSDNNETYTLPVSVGTAVADHTVADIDLTAGGTGAGIKSRVTFAGKDNNILITETVGNNGIVKIALTDDVTITSDLTVTNNTQINGTLGVTGLADFTDQVTVPTATNDANAPNLGQVKLLIAGVGVFQGAYNANTNSPAISGGSNVALNLGDYFVVSVAGNNGGYFPTLEPGDFIFADADIAANSSPAASAYTVVQADANIAGANSTDGGTNKGVAGFDSANFTASSSGWIQLVDRSVAGSYGTASAVSAITVDKAGIVTAAANTTIDITASQVSDFCAAVQVCVADNSDSVLIGDGTATSYTITHNYDTRKIAVQCARTTTPFDTIYLDVERTTVDTLTLTTTTALPTNGVEVFLQIIK